MRSQRIPGALAVLCVFAFVTAATAVLQPDMPAPLALNSARVSIAGSSNIHAYTAATTNIRLTRVQLGDLSNSSDRWSAILEPGAVQAFEVAIPSASLASPKEGLDKNMHKALNVTQHPEITFRLVRLEKTAKPGVYHAVGTLRIHGVERDVALDLTAQPADNTLVVKGQVQLLMTDYGITPPKAMMGMLKTNPQVTVSFETVLAAPHS